MFPISVIILTRDEAVNIADCLNCLNWADEVILVDSFSNDGTIARAFAARPDTRAFQNQFQDFGQQRNWALDHAKPKHEWILFVDADERITDVCAAAIRQAVSSPGERIGFYLCYRNMFLGRWIRHCTHFPSWQLRLLQRGKVRYQKEGHGQREVMDGPAGYIREPFDHLDLSKGMTEWIAKHNIYSSQEIELMLRLRAEPLKAGDLLGDPIQRRRCLKRLLAKLGGSPFGWFFYVYILRGGFLDGSAGRIYCLLRLAQQIHVKAKLAEAEQNAQPRSAVEFHDRIAPQWETKYKRRSFAEREVALDDCLNGVELRGQRWLDAGCGSGRLSRYLTHRGSSVVGVDASAEMIRVATEHANGQAGAMTFRQVQSIETMEVEPSSFDGALCISVLEYLADPDAALSRLSSSLRSGGILIASVPNRASFLRKTLRAVHRVSGWPRYLEFSRNEYEAADFAQILRKHGLTVEKAIYLGGPMPRMMQREALVGPIDDVRRPQVCIVQ